MVSIICDKHYDPKQVGKERVYFIVQLSGHFYHWGKMCRNLAVGAQVETIEKCSSWVAQVAYLCNSEPPAQGQHLLQRTDLPSPIYLNQENILRFTHRPVQCEYFLSWESLFPSDSNLCQVAQATVIISASIPTSSLPVSAFLLESLLRSLLSMSCRWFVIILIGRVNNHLIYLQQPALFVWIATPIFFD